jgi:NitT/TauT family transport system substrate-binding protein
LFILTVNLSGCGPSGPMPTALTSVTVQLRWTHQAQFAGFYAAEQNGYYASEGLKVNFIEGGPKVDLVTPVLSGTAHFSDTAADNLLMARADGKPLRAIATIYRRSPNVFFALAASGLKTPKDFFGKTIHVPRDLVPTFHTMMARVGIHPGQYSLGNYGTDLTPFYSGQVHVWSGIINGQAAYTAQKSGYKLTFIYPDDYGIHFYADTIFTTDDFIAKNPELVRRFLRATLKGWTYGVENPATIASIVAKYKPDADPAYETASMTASLPLINTGEDFIGWMKPEIWVGMEKTLRKQGILKKPVDVKQVYTLEFLKEIYKK